MDDPVVINPLVRFGIIGHFTSNFDIESAISLVPIAKIVAIGSIERHQFTHHNAVPFVGSYNDVIDHPSVDAVFVSLTEPKRRSFAINAARRGKHVLLEIPTVLRLEELDDILKECRDNQVQFMDCTMWLHHPRTKLMKHFIRYFFGKINKVNSICTHYDFVKCNTLELGALGYGGWHCVSSILWAYSYVLPKTVRALYASRSDGVLISCGAQLMWPDGRSATLHCSRDGHLTTQMTVFGSDGTLDVTDFVIPYDEQIANFQHVSNAVFSEVMTGWDRVPTIRPVITELPQDALMVQNFAYLAYSIRELGGKPEMKWYNISRKTRVVIDAVRMSITDRLKPVEISSV